MWRIVNKIEGYLDIDFTTLMIKYLFIWFWGERNISSNVHKIMYLQVGLTNLMFLPTSNTTAPQQELLIASKDVNE